MDADKRDFIAIGTAAGVAVAFGAPIGGCLFAVEEGASFYSQTMLWRGFLATCMGVLTIHWLDQLDFDALDFARAKFGTHRDFGLYRTTKPTTRACSGGTSGKYRCSPDSARSEGFSARCSLR